MIFIFIEPVTVYLLLQRKGLEMSTSF